MIVHARVESSHLAGNLLEDPSERDLFVYLPPGYEDSDRRYPTAYLLHAYGDTAAGLVTPTTEGSGGRHRSKTSSIPCSAGWGWLR